MEKANKAELGSVQETLLLIVWGRAVETQKEKPLLIDNKAVEIMNSISYDFTTFFKDSGRLVLKLTQHGWISRAIYFDRKIKAFMDLYPEATIINIGCGLDTTFSRVDNGEIQWIDLDLPDVIDIRREYFTETARNRFIAKSVFDTSWYDSIENKDHVMLLIAGVLYYLDESQVKSLFKDLQTYLPRAEVVFDVLSKSYIKFANWGFKRWNKSARMIWGNTNVNEIEKWNCGLEVINHISAYKEHKRNYPLIDGLAMSIFQVFKIWTLSHIKIHPPQDS